MKERTLDPSDAVVNELIIAYVKSQRIDLALVEYATCCISNKAPPPARFRVVHVATSDTTASLRRSVK